MELTCELFEDGGEIPSRATCDGEDRSPPLRWSDLPEGTVEVALLCEDPDAPGGTFVHWVAWGIDPSLGGLPDNAVPPGVGQGPNDFGNDGYGGPCPPEGDEPHRYVFTLFALSEPLDVGRGTTADDLRKAMEGKILGEAQLTGRYGRK